MITKNEISSLNLSPTKKDFVQIWNELIEVASKITERWDPTSTNESDPGIVLLKVLTGIADKLNYNIDKNILEAYMPTAAQMESMRKLCELVGYDIKYYQSAETRVRISYTGNTTDRSEDNDEKLPIPSGLTIPKFTTITNADKDITFVTTNTIPVHLTNDTPWVEVDCIEGQISQCESTNENNLITLAQLDDAYRYYLPEIQIAENGIFVYNATTSVDQNNNPVLTDGTAWQQVSNLNTQSSGTRIFKFGYDSAEGRPYLAFPADVGSLIGDGLFIYFIRTSGLSGNISSRTLEVLELPTGKDWENYTADKFEVVNVDATQNGANIESISSAYNNFKKTVGTFDTLVTCRDYMNKIYSLMDMSNSPYVSNVLVTDIRNDINNALTLCSCNEYGILYQETPVTETVQSSASHKTIAQVGESNTYKLVLNTAQEDIEVPLIDHFDLILYPFKTFTQVSFGTKDLADPYNDSFTYTEQMNKEIEASIADLKTCAHNLTSPIDGDVVAINNYLRLNALIATSSRVSEIEAEDILKNIKVALVNEFNLRNLDFGEEIPFDSILAVIENADPRIKVVSLQEPTVLTTFSVKGQSGGTATSKEFGIASTEADKIDGVNYKDAKTGEDAKTAKGETAKDIYNRLVLRNILAGRASLFDYDETFISNNSEKPYTATKNITADLYAKPDSDVAANKIKDTVATLLQDMQSGEAIICDSDKKPIRTGLNSEESVLTLKVFDEDITEKLAEILDDSAHPEHPLAEEVYAIIAERAEAEAVGEYVSALEGLANGIITIVTSADEPAKVYEKGIHEVYETYEPLKDVLTDGVLGNVSNIEAVCEIRNTNDTFKDITLSKNEVIKFRAPNLTTTRTYPAYVYYRFERNGAKSASNSSAGNELSDTEGRYAQCESLNSFIQNTVGVTTFFTKLWAFAGNNVKKAFTAKSADGASGIAAQGEPANTFNTSIAIKADKVLSQANPSGIYADANALSRDLTDYFTANPASVVTFSAYPLNGGTMDVWSTCVKEFVTLPTEPSTVLWRLSSTSGHPKGKFVTEAGQRLYAQSSEYLLNSRVGDVTYICKDLGKSPDYYYMSENSDIELREGDKLYIHYTPSSTNEDGETQSAEPISLVYEGSKTDPVIIRPSGFTLMPSVDVNRQGTSWKKTGVDFGKHGVKDLLALAPNEQIEMRRISRVTLNTAARFYKNFDNSKLEHGNINEVIEYELKDGEYIFYTDQNTQEAAFYGSGSVITLDKGAFIPKAKKKVEVSQILEKGLHIVPWSDYVLLSDTRKVTITEYQYMTLVNGDTLNTLTLAAPNDGNTNGYIINNASWTKCISTEDKPIIYTPAGSDVSVTLPIIELNQGTHSSWEVCSFLELSTSPGYSQQLRTTKTTTENTSKNIADAKILKATGTARGTEMTEVTPLAATLTDTEAKATIENKLNIYTKTGIDINPPITIAPETPGDQISIKLSTIAQSASGTFEKVDPNEDDDIDESVMQIKVFKEEAPAFIQLSNNDEAITPVSNKITSPVEVSSAVLNNLWTKIEVGSQLGKEGIQPAALKLNFMIPKNTDTFGIFSIYLEVPEDRLDGNSKYDIPIAGSRVFIDLPQEFGAFQDTLSIFNYKTFYKEHPWDTKEESKELSWWPEGIVSSNRLYLRAGLNCIRINNPCSILIKAEANAAGSLLYDNMRLVKGRETHGVNLELLDPNATFNTEMAKLVEIDGVKTEEEKEYEKELRVRLANEVLNRINTLDKHHDFYYNVPIENSLAIEFDKNINSLSNPYTLYDINNINNDFVISKLDVKYLDEGLKIAKSSRY